MGKGRQERRRLRKLLEQQGATDNALPAPLLPQGDVQPDPAGTSSGQVKTTRKLFMQLQSYTGPIPPPDLLAGYEQVCPGSANRILGQFEDQGRHRRRIENRVVWSNVVSSIIGQVTGFLLLGGAVAGGVLLLYNDKPIVGLGSIVAAVCGAAWVLRKAEVGRQRELATKRERERGR